MVCSRAEGSWFVSEGDALSEACREQTQDTEASVLHAWDLVPAVGIFPFFRMVDEQPGWLRSISEGSLSHPRQDSR